MDRDSVHLHRIINGTVTARESCTKNQSVNWELTHILFFGNSQGLRNAQLQCGFEGVCVAQKYVEWVTVHRANRGEVPVL